MRLKPVQDWEWDKAIKTLTREEKDDKATYRTSPTTPGLLNTTFIWPDPIVMLICPLVLTHSSMPYTGGLDDYVFLWRLKIFITSRTEINCNLKPFKGLSLTICTCLRPLLICISNTKFFADALPNLVKAVAEDAVRYTAKYLNKY